jgi:hypothetical protein
VPTESELRELLQGGGAPGPLDAERIIRRARARRRPKRIVAGALGGLAVVAVVAPVALGLGTMRPTGASDSAGGAAAGQESADGMSTLTERDMGSLADDPYPDCHLVGWDGDAVPSGVELHLAQAEPGGDVALTLTNDSTEPLRGELAGAPYLALSSGEEPVGWSAASVEMTRVDLQPGEGVTVAVPLDAVGCQDAVLAGDYGAEAALAIRLDDGRVVVATSIRTPVVVTPTN